MAKRNSKKESPSKNSATSSERALRSQMLAELAKLKYSTKRQPVTPKAVNRQEILDGGVLPELRRDVPMLNSLEEAKAELSLPTGQQPSSEGPTSSKTFDPDRDATLFLEARERGEPLVTLEQLKARASFTSPPSSEKVTKT